MIAFPSSMFYIEKNVPGSAFYNTPVYASKTIAVNVTWVERGFNTGQTLSSIFPSSTVYELRSYSEILVGNCNPLAFNVPVGGDHLDDLRDFWWVSCRMARLQYGSKISPKS